MDRDDIRRRRTHQLYFSITLKTYSETDNSFTGSIQVQSTRPVYDSNYSTTVFNFQDENFNFTFQQFDQLEFRPEQVDNNLTAVIAYYAYLIIGMDMDTMAPLGGSDILQMAMDVANNSQNLAMPDGKLSKTTATVLPLSMTI